MEVIHDLRPMYIIDLGSSQGGDGRLVHAAIRESMVWLIESSHGHFLWGREAQGEGSRLPTRGVEHRPVSVAWLYGKAPIACEGSAVWFASMLKLFDIPGKAIPRRL